MAATFAYEPRLKIGEPNVIRPSVCADRDRVAALMVRAVDEDAANASVAHLSEGDLLRAGNGGHSRTYLRRPGRDGSRWILGLRRMGALWGARPWAAGQVCNYFSTLMGLFWRA